MAARSCSSVVGCLVGVVGSLGSVVWVGVGCGAAGVDVGEEVDGDGDGLGSRVVARKEEDPEEA